MKRRRRRRKQSSSAMDSKSKGEECHIALSPETSPIYGGATLEISFSENSILPADTVEFYVVLWGLTARHVTSANRKDYRILEAIVPGHDRFEDAHLAVCAIQPSLSDVRILAKSNFIFRPDSTFYLAQFLASSVWDPDSLDNPQAIKSEHFDLQTEDRSTLDSRLTAAFQHLEFPPSWNLVVDSGRLDENPPPRETLLHFATRLHLISFAEHLLESPGYLTALHLPNKNGELPYHIAKAQELHKLADRMLQLAQQEEITKQRFEKVSSNCSKVKRHNSLGIASVTTKLHESQRTLEEDIQMLREIMSCLEDEHGGDSPDGDSCKLDSNVTSPIPTSPDTLEEILSGESSDREVEDETKEEIEERPEEIQRNKNDELEDDDDAGDDDDDDANDDDGDDDGDDDHDDDDDDGDDDDDDGDDDEDGDNNSEEADEMADSVLSLDEDLDRLRKVTDKVQRFKEQNRPWLSSEEERRENLSRWSTSCPVLMEDGKPAAVWKKEHLPTLPSAIVNSSDEEDDAVESGSRSPGIQIQVNDTILDSNDDLPAITVPIIEDATTTPLSSEEGEDLSSTRRHSWGDQAKEMKSHEMANDMRCRSMLNLDSNVGTEGFHMPQEKPNVATTQPIESQPNKSDSTINEAPTEKSGVTFQDGLSDNTDPEPEVSAILPRDNTRETHSAVVRRRNRVPKDIRKQKSASMFEARSCNIINSVLPEGSLEDPVEAEKKRQARLSLTEFLSDPTNFVPEIDEKGSQAENSSRNPMLRKLSFLKVSKREKKKSKDKEKDKDRDEVDRGGDKERGRIHQFVATSFSNSTMCDCCGKSLVNKPAFQCTACFANVHNHASCKENVGQCSKLTKHPKTQMQKSSGSAIREKFNSKLQGNSLNYTQSLREKPRPNSDQHSLQFSSQSFPKIAFQGSTPELRSPNVGNSFSWSRTIDENDEAEEPPGSPPKNSNFHNNLSYSTESLDDVSSTLQFEPDDDLTSGPEPESWSVSVDKKVLKKMSNKEIKRQDVIFEFIMTEKHHLRTLKVMLKIFSYGMRHELNMDQSIVSKVFPMLDELVDIASTFYESLKSRQSEALAVEKIGDVLCKQFEGENGDRMKTAYGHLCCHQKEAVSVYKDLQKTERKFQQFIKKCSLNAVCRRWSIPECILSVSHRLTKYQLLIEALIKPSKAAKADKQDLADLEKALGLIKGICNEVDFQVQEHEKWQRLIEIYNKVEARSTAPLKNGKKFKKSDLLSSNRKLIKEGEVYWKSARGRLTEVHVVLVSDLLLLLSENNQKYTFAAQDNKPPVISLENLMVRDVAIDNKSIYIISRYKKGPEMYEITCKTTKHRNEWKKAIEDAVVNCPIKEETAEDERKAAEEKLKKMTRLLEEMKEKDVVLEDIIATKIKMMKELHELAVSREDISVQQGRAADSDTNLDQAKDVLQAAIREASSLQSLAYLENPNLLVCRSASSAGERESLLHQTMVLPKRADTFSGFDNSAQGPKKRTLSSLVLSESSSRSSSFPNLSNSEDISKGSPSQLGADDLDISREEEDVLSPMSLPERRDSPQRSPLPQRHNTERSSDSTSGGRRGSTDSRGRSKTVSSGVPNKVQFNVPMDDRKGILSRQDLQNGGGDETESCASGGITSEQLHSVNRLLKHFYTLLPLISNKDNELESLRTELTEAKTRMEGYKSPSPAHSREVMSSAPGSPAGQENMVRAGSGRSSSLHDTSNQHKGDKLNNQKSLPETTIRQEHLDRIAFGDMMPSRQTVKYRNHSQSTYAKESGDATQSLQVAAGQRNRYSSAELLTRMNSWDSNEMNPSPPPTSSSINFKKHTPDHLMSTTNQQAAHNRNIKQQLPLQLSKQSGPKTSPIQQVLPKKLSSGSTKKPISSEKEVQNNFTPPSPSTEEVIFF